MFNAYRQAVVRTVNHVYAAIVTSDASLVANRSFAYIVVGGGTAGLTVASRLSQDGRVSVLVLEAGDMGADVGKRVLWAAMWLGKTVHGVAG